MAARAARALPGRRFSLLLHLIINGPLLLFKGSFSAASILHLPKQELKDVLMHMEQALHNGGIIYTSFKYGNFSGMRNGRFFTDFTEDTFKGYVSEGKQLIIEKMWITRDVRPGRQDEKWLNVILRTTRR
jgi:hypothetical protein